MCYIIVKGFKTDGCLAYESKSQKEASELVLDLESKIDNKTKQVVVISSPNEWEEYEPYTLIADKEDFKRRALILK